MNLAEKICCAIRDSGYGIEAETGEKFAEYLRFLTEYNRSVNLTAITDEDGIILKHFVDSLSALPYTDCCAEVLDLGSGAGFPGVPMKLVRPDIRLTALDSSGKKCAFLRALTARIGVGAEILEGRAEETGEARWMVQDGLDMGVPLPVTAASLFARQNSQLDDPMTMKVVAALRNQFGGHAVHSERA